MTEKQRNKPETETESPTNKGGVCERTTAQCAISSENLLAMLSPVTGLSRNFNAESGAIRVARSLPGNKDGNKEGGNLAGLTVSDHSC